MRERGLKFDFHEGRARDVESLSMRERGLK